MRSKHLRTALAHLFLAAALTANPLEIAGATDRSDPRRLELQRDLRSVRSRVERAPRASSFELKDLQRRLHGLRIEAPRDPRLQELKIELRRLRAQVDRTVDRAGAAALPRTSPLATNEPIEKPRYLGGAHTPASATPARPYFGQRLVALQRTVAASERGLELGDTAAAARLLEAARGDLAILRTVFDDAVAEDPNLIALEERIRRSKSGWRRADPRETGEKDYQAQIRGVQTPAPQRLFRHLGARRCLGTAAGAGRIDCCSCASRWTRGELCPQDRLAPLSGYRAGSCCSTSLAQ